MVGTEEKVSNYYNVSNGKIVRSFGKKEPENIETKSRTNKNGDVVYEQLFDFIKGKIVNATLQSHDEYGDSIKLSISDGENIAELQIKFDSAYGRSFLFKLPNFDSNDEVKITPYSFVNKEGKDVTGLNIFILGKKIANYYTKEEPNGLPQLKKVKFNGKEQWDKTEQIEFLLKKYNEFCSKFNQVVTEENNDDLDF